MDMKPDPRVELGIGIGCRPSDQQGLTYKFVHMELALATWASFSNSFAVWA